MTTPRGPGRPRGGGGGGGGPRRRPAGRPSRVGGGHPGAWDWDVAALSAVVVVGTLRGKALLPRRAPPGLEVLVLVGPRRD